jgi:hypothetical protein
MFSKITPLINPFAGMYADKHFKGTPWLISYRLDEQFAKPYASF